MPFNAEISSEQMHEGVPSMVLTVSSACEPFQISRTMPVNECQKYKLSGWIYIDHIEEDPQRSIVNDPEYPPVPSDGTAWLLFQFGDKNGKWFVTGSTTKRIKESGKWIFIESNEIPAPKGAGFADIYLEIRGKGKVFFNKISFSDCERAPVKLLTPRDTAAFTETRPSFTWEPDEFSEFYELNISGDKIKVAGSSYRLKKELPPGNYFWTVTPQGSIASERRNFKIIRKQGDAAGPDILPFEQQIASGDEPLKITVTDNSGIDVARTELIIAGTKTDCIAGLEGNTLAVRAKDGFKRGAYCVVVKVFDNVGNATTGEAWIVCAPHPSVKRKWTQRGIKTGNSYFFPNMLYSVEPADMAKVADGGFNTVQSYRFENGKGDTIENACKYLDAAHENNLYVLMGFARKDLLNYDLKAVADWIAALRDHPALLCWYLFDEPDIPNGPYVIPARLSNLYELIKKLDPFHPVVVSFTHFNSISAYAQKCFDIHWTQNYDVTVFPGKYIKWKEVLGARLSMLIINSQKITDAKVHRFQSAMAIILKSPGLAWWCYGGLLSQQPYQKDNGKMWEAFSDVSHELNKVAECFITSEGEDIKFKLDVLADNVSARVRKTQKGIAVIVANTSGKKRAFKLEIPGVKTCEYTLESKAVSYDIIPL